MKEEISEGVNFLRQFLAKYGQMSQSQIDEFASRLTHSLERRYANHWYEWSPMKGQAFRCLRLKRSEQYVDATISAILGDMHLSLSQLGLPDDFTLWIDPGEVSVRFGDLVGLTYTIAKVDKSGELEAARAKLIVQNSDKIFDDTLTAFIRQNSSGHELADVAFSLDDLHLNHSSLPLDKRTISPPLTSRAHSSTVPILADCSHFSSSSSSCASSFGSEHNQLAWLPGAQLFPPADHHSLNFLNFDFMKSSDTASERSDTPNSSTTTSSYFGNFSSAFDGLFAADTADTAAPDMDEVQTPKKVSDSEEEKSKPAKKSDSAYCGYVESFPYYYKLNRLYNALALQKMQTERLKKAGLLSHVNQNNPAAVAQAYAAFQATGQMAASPPKHKQRANFKANLKSNKKSSQPTQQKNF